MKILIDRVRIINFRSLKNVEIGLEPLTLLVGVNNSGKTSFLRALNLALGIERKIVSQEDLFIDKDGNQQAEKAIIVDIRIIPVNGNFQRIKEFDEKWASEFGKDIQPDDSGEFFAFRTRYSFQGQKDETRAERFFIRNWENQDIAENDKLSALLDAIPLYFIDAQRDLLEDLKVRNSYFGKLAAQIKFNENKLKEIEEQLDQLNETTVESADVLRHLKLKLEELNQAVHTKGKGVEITPFPKRIRDLHKGLKIHFQDNDSEMFGLEYHGMGTRSWASILSFKAYASWEENPENPEKKEPYHPLLALEEPESHLHPNAQRQLYNQLKNMQGQKIISTHSPYIAGQAELHEIRHFFKGTDETKINPIELGYDKKLSETETRLTSAHPSKKVELEREIKSLKDSKREFLRKYRNVIMNTRGELLFARVLVFCEGETEEQALPIFAEKYFGTSIFNLGVNIISVNGYESYSPFITIANSLNISWFIFSDGEDKAINSILKTFIEMNADIEKIVSLPNQYNFEQYLLAKYADDIKMAIAEYLSGNSKAEQFISNKRQEVDNWDKEKIESFMEDRKTKLSPLYANKILSTYQDERMIPNEIKLLFVLICKELNIESPLEKNWKRRILLKTLNCIISRKKENEITGTLG